MTWVHYTVQTRPKLLWEAGQRIRKGARWLLASIHPRAEHSRMGSTDPQLGPSEGSEIMEIQESGPELQPPPQQGTPRMWMTLVTHESPLKRFRG